MNDEFIKEDTCHVFYDLETTGVSVDDGAEISMINAIKCRNNAIIGRFSTLVKCNETLSEAVEALTGITNEMLENAPSITAALKNFKEFIGDALLFGYKTDFDFPFFEKADKDFAGFLRERTTDLYPIVKAKHGEAIQNYQFKDKLDEIRAKTGGKERKRLNSLTISNVCKYFGIDENISEAEKLHSIYLSVI